jgi:hypothetical protein
MGCGNFFIVKIEKAYFKIKICHLDTLILNLVINFRLLP